MKYVWPLVKKETLQIIRDPSSILIAFILPLILLLIFAYAVNLDNNKIRLGLLVEGYDHQANDIIDSFKGTEYLEVIRYINRSDLQTALIRGDIKAALIVPNDFAKNIGDPNNTAHLQVLSDASDPNIALFISSYAQGVLSNWQRIFMQEQSITGPTQIQIEPVIWFNPELKSRNFILPGSIAIIMTLVGMILTALVISREWERGTMESLLTTKISKMDFILSKYIAYYGLALCSTLFCTVLCVFVFHVPFRGSFIVYLIVSSLFIATALGQGFIVSTLAKNQFLAAITSAMLGFLPAVMLSGFLFEISSMPTAISWITYFIPARYFAPAINNLFLGGNIWSIILPQSFFLLIGALLLFFIMYKITKERLE